MSTDPEQHSLTFRNPFTFVCILFKCMRSKISLSLLIQRQISGWQRWDALYELFMNDQFTSKVMLSHLQDHLTWAPKNSLNALLSRYKDHLTIKITKYRYRGRS